MEKSTTKSCIYCNLEFRVKPCERRRNRRYCSPKCRELANTEARICETCNGTFRYRLIYKKTRQTAGRFCSIDCANEWRRKTKVDINCLTCNRSLQISPVYIKRGGKYCSHECYQEMHRLLRRTIQTTPCNECGSNDGYKSLGLCKRCYCKFQVRGYKQKIIDGYGGRCACCGETTFEFLSLDHVNDDGAKERNEHYLKHGYVLSGATLYRKVIAEGFPPTYQLLCMNCNWAKGMYGQCPHQRE